MDTNCITVGPAPLIIAAALKLGLLVKPSRSQGIASKGEALEVTESGFYFVTGGGYREPYRLLPYELLCDWSLTTFDIIRQEYEKDGEAW